MTPITPTDDIVGPIVHQMATLLRNNLVGTFRMYEEVPDGPVEANSFLFPLKDFRVDGDTAGKEYVVLTFNVMYVVRRSVFSQNMLACYAMLSAALRILSSWSAQTLSGLSIAVTPRQGGVSQFTQAGQPYVALILTTDVRTEFNILTS